ncbi:MAG: sortase B protein-sorting domain-containing protein [Eubacterium sp.]|nr:sortase B protein-sorting domain-containing protein [Eubacterium sp.]
MKKTIKYVSLIAVLVLSLVSSVTAMAEDRKGTSGWQVSFDGKKMESNFSSANMGDEINSMQPGDSVELTVTIKNTFNGQADWYMKNEVLEALEDAADAAGGAYDYLLTYTDAKGETTTLYSSEKFGGDGKINGVGLHGATKTLDDYFYLERLGDNGKGTVKLKVALDGETLVNDYQNTLARLQMDFATELVQPGTQAPGQQPGQNPDTPGGRRDVVRTGDDTQIMLYVALMFASGLVLLCIVILRFRREQEEDTVLRAEGRR